MPLVSCIMPTAGRPEFALQAVRYFERQSYPARELIIVDDGPEDLGPCLPADERIRYLRLPPGYSIGTKRNYACENARGEYIAQWDDDDWYAPERLEAQIAPLAAGQAEICGLEAGVFFDLPAWRFWSLAPELRRQLFVADVHGGTLVFHRSVWERFGPYPDSSLAEDAVLLKAALAGGARLVRVPGRDLFLYLRHGANAWAFVCGQYLDPAGWREEPEPGFSAEDLAFYRERQSPREQPRPPRRELHNKPLVTCMMPTAGRRRFVPHAIHTFLAQDYPERELLIVDDGADAIEDLVPADPRIRYLRLKGKRTVGTKRNIACREARGEVIVHWDDDDWSAPWRLTYQVGELAAEQADICGIDRVLFWGPNPGQAWQYQYPSGERPWVYGGALCYTRELWLKNRFPDVRVGEDCYFVWSGRPMKVLRLRDNTFYVGLIHAGNTSPKSTCDSRWTAYAPDAVRRLLGADCARFEALLSAGAGQAVEPAARGHQ